MATVIFYEKPGCINNTKQKAILTAAGHCVEARNLLTEPWTAERLRSFFGNRPVVDWFNPAAPAIKSGWVRPDLVDGTTAIELMLADPLLIRRPLIRVGDRRSAGFDAGELDSWLGLNAIDPVRAIAQARLLQQDLQTCPNH